MPRGAHEAATADSSSWSYFFIRDHRRKPRLEEAYRLMESMVMLVHWP